MDDIDHIRLNFSPAALDSLNYILAFIMFGVALELRFSDFQLLIKEPKKSLTGVLSQFVLLPAFTFLLVYFLSPKTSIALGLFMVAACPGGNISNFITHLAKGNTALSVTLTAFGTLISIVMVPFNFYFWAGLYPPTASMVKEIAVDGMELFKAILMIAGIPIVLGMLFAAWKPSIAMKLSKWFKPISILIFIGFVAIAFANNFTFFKIYIGNIFLFVLLHNVLAMGVGYFFSFIMKLPEKDRRTIAIETGIQNSGMGLILIFGFFNGLGGMAMVAAWWGIWHIVTGMGIAAYWSKR